MRAYVVLDKRKKPRGTQIRINKLRLGNVYGEGENMLMGK